LYRAEAYAKLTAELERWQGVPFGDLVKLVDTPPSVTSVPVGAENIEVVVHIRWAKTKPGTIRIEAIANGPSCWKLDERLEEAVIVSAPKASKGG
jgi:hypothetical protein